MKPTMNLAKLGFMSLFALLAFSSCKKDPSVEKPTDPTSSKLKKVSSNDDTIEFGYAADGSLQSVKTDNGIAGGGPATFAIHYGADKKISDLTAADGSRIVPHYDNGEITTADLYEDNQKAALVRYEYLNGFLKSTVMEIQGIEAMKFSFTYDANGNISRTSTWAYNPATGQLASTGHTDYQYDGKANPMLAHKTVLYLLLQNISKNNITRETEYDEKNTVSETVEYTYTYNNQNLPQSAAVKTTPAGGAPVNSTLTFLYQ